MPDTNNSSAVEPVSPRRRTRGRPPNPALRQAKHDRMLSAAIHLFSDHGFDMVSVEQIALAAGQSKGAFYWYFEDKEDCLKKILINKDEEMVANLGKIDSSTLSAREKLLTLSDYRNWSDDTFIRTLGLVFEMTHSTTPSVRDLTNSLLAKWNRMGAQLSIKYAKEACLEAGWTKDQISKFDFDGWVFIYLSIYNGIYHIMKRKEYEILPSTEQIAKMLHHLIIHPLTEKKA